jgi:hypothetical protein
LPSLLYLSLSIRKRKRKPVNNLEHQIGADCWIDLQEERDATFPTTA